MQDASSETLLTRFEGAHVQSLHLEMLDSGLSTRAVRLLHVLKTAVKWGQISYPPTERATALKQHETLNRAPKRKHWNLYQCFPITSIGTPISFFYIEG